MKNVLKERLLLLLEELGSWTGNFSTDTDEEADLNLPDNAYAIGVFVKNCAIELNDFELMGISEAVIQKAKTNLLNEEKAWEEYDKFQEEEYWRRKEYYSATDICERLNLPGGGAGVNKLLEAHGYQVKQSNGWVATDKSNGLCAQMNLEDGKRPYIRWNAEFIQHLSNELSS